MTQLPPHPPPSRAAARAGPSGDARLSPSPVTHDVSASATSQVQAGVEMDEDDTIEVYQEQQGG